VLTGEIRNQIDIIWNDFWAGGVANPLSVIEQMTYLLFIKRLDELHTLEERKSQTLKIPMERRIFPEGMDGDGEKARPYEDLRWSRFKNFEAREMMEVVDEHVFPFLRKLGAEGSSYGRHMRDARLGFSNPALLFKVVEKLDKIPMEDRDTKGDVYEYMLGKIASAGPRSPTGQRRSCKRRSTSWSHPSSYTAAACRPRRPTASSTRWSRTPPTARCSGPAVSTSTPASPRSSSNSSRKPPRPSRSFWRITAGRPAWHRQPSHTGTKQARRLSYAWRSQKLSRSFAKASNSWRAFRTPLNAIDWNSICDWPLVARC
jgi:hypothetical protein